jgi:hypothetical protein
MLGSNAPRAVKYQIRLAQRYRLLTRRTTHAQPTHEQKWGLNIKKCPKNRTKIKKHNMHLLIATWVLLQGPNSRPIFRAKTNFMWSFLRILTQSSAYLVMAHYNYIHRPEGTPLSHPSNCCQ